MEALLEREKLLLDSLEDPVLSLIDRNKREKELDDIRETLETTYSFNTMDSIYHYIKTNQNLRGLQNVYSAKGFTNPQFLMANIMHTSSPLKSILLYHGVGVGKTCAAIAAASSYTQPKQIIVLTPSDTLVKNWKEEFIGKNLCGRYIWNIPTSTWKTLSDRKKSELFNSHVSIMGYLKFANMIGSLTKDLLETDPSMDETYAMIKAIRLKCDNTIIIMDEVHNTRQIETSSIKQDELKKIRPVLTLAAKYARQNKFVLLSASPMYNDVKEIEWILNLLRWNQGLSGTSWKEWYNAKENDWKSPTSRSKEYLTSKLRGFVSYIRGENPFTFPKRIDPDESKYTLLKEGGIVMVQSELSEEMEEVIQEIGKESKDAFATKTIQNLLSVQSKLSLLKEENEWSFEGMRAWAPKMATAYNAISKSVGPCFVYSQYLQHGIYEMAYSMERMGWVRVGGASFLSQKEREIASKNPYCWNHKCGRKDIPTDSTLPFKQAKYALVDGSSKNLYSILQSYNQETNKDGSIIACLLGSRVIEVGVSLKRTRQVHIMEPWFHLNSMEQATGRAIRNRSHADLPQEERNVTIYLHCAIQPSTRDSSDLRMYRQSVEKMRMMSQVTKLMAENAIDCDIQAKINYIRDSTAVGMKDSFGKEIKVIRGDTDFSSRCNYSTCEIRCVDMKDSSDDTSYTLNPDKVFPTQRDILKERLPSVIQSLSVIDVESVAENMQITKEIAKEILDDYVKEKRSFQNINNLKSYIQALDDTMYIVSLFPQTIFPLEYVGQAATTSSATQIQMNEITKPDASIGLVKSQLGIQKVTGKKVMATKATTDVELASSFDDMMGELERLLKLVHGLSPMTKSIEMRGSLEISRLNTTKALKKQAAYQRFIGYSDKRKAGEVTIAKQELYPSIIISFVEHLTPQDKDKFLRELIEKRKELGPTEGYTIQYLCDYLSQDGLGMSPISFLMNYKKQIEPYLPGDYVKQLNDKKLSDAPLNAYMYTVKEKGQQKQKGIIKVWMDDGTWETIPASIMIEWKTAIAPSILSNKRKLEDDSVWIHAWINPATYKFMLRIPRAKPEGTTIKTKKEKILGGLCGQTTYAKHVEEIVELIETLTGIEYLASGKRITVGRRQLPSGIYWPKASGTDILKSMYLGGVNKVTSKTSTGASLCEELEYILRIIAFSGKTHPYKKWVEFHSSLEYYVEN